MRGLWSVCEGHVMSGASGRLETSTQFTGYTALSLSLHIYIYIYTYIHIHNEECGFGRNAKPGSVWRPATTHGQARTSWDEAWAPYSGSFLPESGPIRLAENASEWRLLHPKRAG